MFHIIKQSLNWISHKKADFHHFKLHGQIIRRRTFCSKPLVTIDMVLLLEVSQTQVQGTLPTVLLMTLGN